MTRQHLAAIAAVSLLAGCASVKHTRIADDNADRGIRYYRTSPYLIAYSDGKGGIVTEVWHLPDPKKKMSARPAGRLADVSTTLAFDRGVLTQATDTGDATAIPTAIAKAVEAFAPTLLGMLNEAQQQKEYSLPAPYVYKIVVDGNNVRFLGNQGDAEVKITLLPQTAKEK